MTLRIACLAVLLAAPSVASAQPQGYRGGMSAPGYRGGLGAPGYRGNYSTFGTFGVPYAAGLGYPYGYPFGGVTLGFGVGGLGYGYGMGSAYGYGMGGNSGGYRYAPAPSVRTPQYVPVEPIPNSTEPAVAVVNLIVPEGAKIWFNDKEVDAPGGKATYTSPVIQPGQAPTLQVKTRWDDRERSMSLTLRPGDKMSVDLRK